MENIFDRWKTRNPQYRSYYKPLFEFFARKGDQSKSERQKEDLGKSFSKYYELYIYAFFLGLYKNEKISIEKGDDKSTFGQPIQFWGNVNSFDRINFSIIQEYMFAAIVANSSIDLLELENSDEKEVEKAVRSLIKDMEAYANGGFSILQEKFDDNKSSFFNKEVFINMILPEQ